MIESTSSLAWWPFPGHGVVQSAQRSTASQQPSQLQVADRKRGIFEQAGQFALNNLRWPQMRTFVNDKSLISGAQQRLLDRLETCPRTNKMDIDRPGTPAVCDTLKAGDNTLSL